MLKLKATTNLKIEGSTLSRVVSNPVRKRIHCDYQAGSYLGELVSPIWCPGQVYQVLTAKGLLNVFKHDVIDFR
ncbi:hypothetical protein AB0756_39695 [Tolypothrix campylonemoides VB511288_2]|uniref:Transposase n=2 Tax=Tolypothrix TaxID=111782 RepID=A0ABW8XMH9_9CYAN